METVFIQLAVILFTAFVVSYIVKRLNQPIIIGYIIAGIIISPFLINIGTSTELIDSFSDLGISFLLFIVGLHLNPKVIKEIGSSSMIIGTVQIILTAGITFLVSYFLLDFNLVTSLYFGVALAFSSTIIIMKILSDKKQLDSLHGKLSIGILILQDLIAIGVLMFISSISGRATENPLQIFLAGTIVIGILFLIGYFILPRIMGKITKSQELLFLFSICWCFVLAALFSYIGFSMEIGSLIAGIILSTSPYATEISSKIRPLRDFFLIIFFIILGLQIKIDSINSILLNAIIFSGIALVLKPLIIMFTSKFFSYSKRTNFIVGGTLGQISEFSLIVLGLGYAVGHITNLDVSTMVLTLAITILLSSYFITYSGLIYSRFSNPLGILERKKTKREEILDKKYDAILFGYNRIGFSILKVLKAIKKKYLVVDYNPETIEDLRKFKIPSVYGDVYDADFLEDLPLNKIGLAISTIPDVETNKLLIENIRSVNNDAIIILRAHNIEDALELYNKGANYVLTPHFLGGEYVAKMVKHSKTKRRDYSKERKKHIKLLTEIMEKGHKHPEIERD